MNLLRQFFPRTSLAFIFSWGVAIGSTFSLVARSQQSSVLESLSSLEYISTEDSSRPAVIRGLGDMSPQGECGKDPEQLRNLIFVTSGGEASFTLEGLGTTVSPNPTLWFHVPYSGDVFHSMQFRIRSVGSETSGQYELTANKENLRPGIMSVTIPDNIELLTGEYLFDFRIFCEDPTLDPSTRIMTVWGTLYVKEVDEPLQSELEAAASKPTELEREWNKALAYANHGIWYDALTTVSNLIIEAEEEQKPYFRQNAWVPLLEAGGHSEFVSDDIEIVDCCTASLDTE